MFFGMTNPSLKYLKQKGKFFFDVYARKDVARFCGGTCEAQW